VGPPADPARAGEHRPDRAARRHRWSYALQAAIAACHARATAAEDTDWERITALYDGLARISPSPVVELNRAVATAQAFGPEAGLEIVRPLFEVPAMRDYHLLPAVAGDLLCRSGAHEQAREHFLRAAALTRNSVERRTMHGRAAQCATRHSAAS
jgi:RNA polymerase sigma-70 factor, ECF subfamily